MGNIFSYGDSLFHSHSDFTDSKWSMVVNLIELRNGEENILWGVSMMTYPKRMNGRKTRLNVGSTIPWTEVIPWAELIKGKRGEDHLNTHSFPAFYSAQM